MKPIRVLIVDDHPLIRRGLRSMLENHEDIDQDIEVVEEAENGERAVQLAEKLQPDVILMDLKMNGSISGLEAIRAIQQVRPGQRILVLTSYDDQLRVANTISAGVSYLLKESDENQIISAITAVHTGNRVFSPSVIDTYDLKPPILPTEVIKTIGQMAGLSTQQLGILQLIMRNFSNNDIKDILSIASHTVANHVTEIHKRIGLETRARQELISKVRELAVNVY